MRQPDVSKQVLTPWALLLAMTLVPPAGAAWGSETSGPSSSAVAENRQTAYVYRRGVVPGERATRLLDIQRSGRLATPRPQTLSGAVQTRIYRRYVNSFTHAIPDTYIDMDFGE